MLCLFLISTTMTTPSVIEASLRQIDDFDSSSSRCCSELVHSTEFITSSRVSYKGKKKTKTARRRRRRKRIYVRGEKQIGGRRGGLKVLGKKQSN